MTEYWQPDKLFSSIHFFVTHFDTAESFNNLDIISCSILLVLISLLFPCGMTISSTFLEFAANKGFHLIILPAILFPLNSTIASAALRTTILDAVLENLVLFYEF